MPSIDLKGARLWLLAAALLLASCATTVTRQAYRHGRLDYRVGALPAEWQPIRFRGANLAFRHRSGGTITASGYCPGGDDVPLEVLTNHLLFGIKTRSELGSTLFMLDGRQALRTHLLGELDGVPIELDLVVLKKDGCTYDLQLVGVSHQFELRQPAFEAFAHGFATVPQRPEQGRGE